MNSSPPKENLFFGLKQLPPCVDRLLVMLTSSREMWDMAGCYQLGVNAHVVKPIDFGDFMRAISGSAFFGWP